MKRSVFFLVLLVLGLALLTAGAMRVIDNTTRRWFERDLAQRAQLAVTSTRQGLLTALRQHDVKGLGNLLSDITHDERIMAIAACGVSGEPIVATPAFPAAFACARLRPQLELTGTDIAWQSAEVIQGGLAHGSAHAVRDEGGKPLGFIVLVQDMSLVEQREVRMHQLLLLGFAVLSIVAAIMSLVGARLSWWRWTQDLRGLLRGDFHLPQFRSFVSEVRDLVDRVTSEQETSTLSGRWSPARLKQVLSRYLHGERVVILANREPYIHVRRGEAIEVQHPASGLVTALEPVMRACSGTWVAHGSGSADRETVDESDRVRVPPDDEAYSIRRVWLTEEQTKGYYYGFANEGLWPLSHNADTRPIFRASDWKHYQEVNAKFARAVCDEVDSDDPIILVQDYHFALAPKLIRERLPRATILTFWHIPWPNSERFSVCPWRKEILEGLLGSSILGFHIQLHCNNFLDAVDRLLEARIDREDTAVVQNGRPTLIRPYPISVDWPSRWIGPDTKPETDRQEVFKALGLRPDALLGVGVDRLDYTKGIEERLLAVERMLERYPGFRGRFTFVQLAAPSRTEIDSYRDLNVRVEELAARINDRFAFGDYRPVILDRAHHEPPKVFRYYRAADLCYVSSLHDGMNLVAKEFVSARDDERGVLVLSHFTGAARELTEALVVNPYDLEEASAALATALRMPLREQKERMRSMRSLVSEFNVYRWAGRMLMDAARLRRRERLTGRLLNDFLDMTGSEA